MQSGTQTIAIATPTESSVSARWAGRVISAIPVLFLLMDGVMKLFKPAVVVDTMAQLGYPESTAIGIGALLLACLAVHLVPRTAMLGAVLVTGFLGGAVATHVRVGSGVFPVVFPVILGTLLWCGLMLRDRRARAALFGTPTNR